MVFLEAIRDRLRRWILGDAVYAAMQQQAAEAAAIDLTVTLKNGTCPQVVGAVGLLLRTVSHDSATNNGLARLIGVDECEKPDAFWRIWHHFQGEAVQIQWESELSKNP